MYPKLTVENQDSDLALVARLKRAWDSCLAFSAAAEDGHIELQGGVAALCDSKVFLQITWTSIEATDRFSRLLAVAWEAQCEAATNIEHIVLD